MNGQVDVEVIIVGAGIAGLTAAFTILEKEPSINILLLESTDRIGGRTLYVPLQVRDKDEGKGLASFEIGGDMVYKEQVSLMNLLKRLNIPIIKSPIDGKKGSTILYYRSAVMYVGSDNCDDCLQFLEAEDKLELSRFIVKVEKLCKELRDKPDPEIVSNLCRMRLDVYVEENLKSIKARAVLEHMVITCCGTTSSEISVLFYVFFCMSSNGLHYHVPITGEKLRPHFKIQGGTAHLCQTLLRHIGSRYVVKNEHVRSIFCKSRHVRIVTDYTSYRCYTVIVTVPQVEISNIYFEPPLTPEKASYLQKIARGLRVTTFVVTYAKAFWKELGFSGKIYAFSKTFGLGPIHTCCDISNGERSALSGRIIESRGLKKMAGSFKVAVLEELASLFGAEALHPLDYFEKTWSDSRKCSQMFCWGTDVVAYINVMTKPHERIFWAGSETSKEWYGTIAGAVNSGIRAGLEVLYDLRPASLNSADVHLISSACPKRRISMLQQRGLIENRHTERRWKCYLLVILTTLYLLWKQRKRFFD